mmetsp:Transcript_92932/g.248694  ORF Transcript_92932/g.248694 Transcript_92932/m.248694 type:complete len:438 (-) Transcript_92932:105-1418(-)
MRLSSCLALASASTCNTKTEHTCYTQACPGGLGATQCFLGQCTCMDGTCADDDGICRPGIADFCTQDTGGTCAHASCENFRGPTDCYNGKCFCKKGYCADTTGVCQPSGKGVVEKWSNELNGGTDFTCKHNTGGSCLFNKCLAGRGPTTCSFASCTCAPGTCSDDQGICHSVIIPNACSRETGGTCAHNPCDAYRGPTECSGDKQCLCKSGFCADSSGVCKPSGESVYDEAGSVVGGDKAAALLAEIAPPAVESETLNNGVAPLVVAALVAMAAGAKWKLENKKRPSAVFMADTVKQVAGASSLFMINQAASAQMMAAVGGSQCSWFAMMSAVDCTVGLGMLLGVAAFAKSVVQTTDGSRVLPQTVAWVAAVCATKMITVYAMGRGVDVVMPSVIGISNVVAGAMVIMGVVVPVVGCERAVRAPKYQAMVTEPLLHG